MTETQVAYYLLFRRLTNSKYIQNTCHFEKRSCTTDIKPHIVYGNRIRHHHYQSDKGEKIKI